MSITAIKDELLTQPTWFIYMIRTRQDFIYTGITTDVTRRVKQHNGELVGGAKALRGKGPHNIEAVWGTHSRASASKFEYYIKTLKKSQKEQLILATNDKALKIFSETSQIRAQRIRRLELPIPS